MEERSVRVYQQKTFFSKIGNTISKLLIPTKVGFNGMMISVKRNNLLKAYEAFKNFNLDDTSKKEQLNKKYEDTFTLYLESIDKYVMDSVYKKVKNGSASTFEEEALSNYYTITHLKETQYLEYKYRKQKYLLELDHEGLKSSSKEKNIKRFNKFYTEKMDTLYKGILKNYSVQLADNLKTSANDKIEIYDKVFDTIEEYILNILTIKINSEDFDVDKETLEQYDKYAKFLAGKPDSVDILEKKTIILAISRKIFTHSLPLIVAEQCYEQLLNEVRSELAHSRNDRKFKKAYKMSDKRFCNAFVPELIINAKMPYLSRAVIPLKMDKSCGFPVNLGKYDVSGFKGRIHFVTARNTSGLNIKIVCQCRKNKSAVTGPRYSE